VFEPNGDEGTNRAWVAELTCDERREVHISVGVHVRNCHVDIFVYEPAIIWDSPVVFYLELALLAFVAAASLFALPALLPTNVYVVLDSCRIDDLEAVLRDLARI
jgi:hypothetical protein